MLVPVAVVAMVFTQYPSLVAVKPRQISPGRQHAKPHEVHVEVDVTHLPPMHA